LFSGNRPRVARWFVFKPKIQIWVNFGGSCNLRCWYILWTLGPFYGLLLYFMHIWYSSWYFGKFLPFWYFVPRKIWQPWTGRPLVPTKICFCSSAQKSFQVDSFTSFSGANPTSYHFTTTTTAL
jgi:hypothetical protein